VPAQKGDDTAHMSDLRRRGMMERKRNKRMNSIWLSVLIQELAYVPITQRQFCCLDSIPRATLYKVGSEANYNFRTVLTTKSVRIRTDRQMDTLMVRYNFKQAVKMTPNNPQRQCLNFTERGK